MRLCVHVFITFFFCRLDHFLSQDTLFDLKAAEEECEQKIDGVGATFAYSILNLLMYCVHVPTECQQGTVLLGTVNICTFY